MKPELDEETKRLLKCLVDHFDGEDRGVRERQIRVWRRLKLLWENIQHTYYSEVAHDWRIPDSTTDATNDQGYYDKPVNVYRAYLESIIAALSVTVPPIVCFPDDAENPLDVSTAKAGDKIAELIFKHTDAPLVWLHALFVYCTEGMTACYCYAKEDEAYGTYEEKKYETETQTQEQQICPLCQSEMADPTIVSNQKDKFQPGDSDVLAQGMLMSGQEMDICPNCAKMVIPELQYSPLTITKLIGVTRKPKSRVCLEVFGGLMVKVPVWARNQKDCTYLIYSYETHYANALEHYPDLRDKISAPGKSTSGVHDVYEQWGRLSPQYHGEYPINNVTVRNCWFRPAAFNILQDEETEEMKKRFPNGVKICMVNDQVADACNDSLDDSWTLTYNPLSDYIHFDPIGLLLTSVQDITNDLISLVLQTIEHGIPQTFADPKVLNFNAYRQSEVIPGGIYPATPKSGKPLSEGFYEVKTATLSQEVMPFTETIQQYGQLVSGALPSLFGGQMAGGSGTASEYSMSRAQALQRLQTTWKLLTMWWKTIFSKAIPLYMKEMKEDERNVQKDEFGNFVNVFIRKAEMEGKIGSVELEANENLPITWSQQKDAVMKLFEINNEQILATLATPENMPFLKKAIGLTDYIIPGENDRQKQFEEIQKLMDSEPIQLPPDPMAMEQAAMMGMPPPPPQELPSVEADQDLDNHALEADVCRAWLVSEAGRLAKIENPPGYKNVLLHMKMHKDIIQMLEMQAIQQQMMAQQAQMPPQGDVAKPPQKSPPIQEERDVQAAY